MSARPTWKGFLKLDLISVPVRAYSVMAAGHGDIHLYRVHAKCGKRIRHQDVCPVHGEVDKDEIVAGYEQSKGQYITVEPEELERLRTESDRAIAIQTFIHADALDPIYYSGRHYYLIPEGPAEQKSFAVLHEVMADENRYAVAQLQFYGHEETVAIRPFGGILLMTVLNYESQVKKPSAYTDELKTPRISGEEVRLMRSLVQVHSEEDFDFSTLKDVYTEQLAQLIESKAAGKKIEPVQREPEPAVLDLLDALRQSLLEANEHGAQPAAAGHGRELERHHRPSGRRRR